MDSWGPTTRRSTPANEPSYRGNREVLSPSSDRDETLLLMLTDGDPGDMSSPLAAELSSTERDGPPPERVTPTYDRERTDRTSYR